jgi:hypothetical protein
MITFDQTQRRVQKLLNMKIFHMQFKLFQTVLTITSTYANVAIAHELVRDNLIGHVAITARMTLAAFANSLTLCACITRG